MSTNTMAFIVTAMVAATPVLRWLRVGLQEKAEKQTLLNIVSHWLPVLAGLYAPWVLFTTGNIKDWVMAASYSGYLGGFLIGSVLVFIDNKLGLGGDS